MKYDIAYASRLGNRHNNEDRFTVVETPHAIFMALADGMGGHRGGQLAAQILVDCSAQLFNNIAKPIADPKHFLEDVIRIAHLDVIQAGRQQQPPMEPRTTCVLCLVQDGYAWWAHVGDSRLYHLRFSRVISHTVDHSEVEELFQRGLISEQEKLIHPSRNMVLQCIGSSRHNPLPSLSAKTALQRGDVLLLCSDGLWSAYSDDLLGKQLRGTDLVHNVEQLASDAEARTYPNSDNISVVAMRWQSSTAIEAAPLDPGASEYDELAEGLDEIDRALKDLDFKG